MHTYPIETLSQSGYVYLLLTPLPRSGNYGLQGSTKTCVSELGLPSKIPDLILLFVGYVSRALMPSPPIPCPQTWHPWTSGSFPVLHSKSSTPGSRRSSQPETRVSVFPNLAPLALARPYPGPCTFHGGYLWNLECLPLPAMHRLPTKYWPDHLPLFPFKASRLAPNLHPTPAP